MKTMLERQLETHLANPQKRESYREYVQTKIHSKPPAYDRIFDNINVLDENTANEKSKKMRSLINAFYKSASIAVDGFFDLAKLSMDCYNDTLSTVRLTENRLALGEECATLSEYKSYHHFEERLNVFTENKLSNPHSTLFPKIYLLADELMTMACEQVLDEKGNVRLCLLELLGIADQLMSGPEIGRKFVVAFTSEAIRVMANTLRERYFSESEKACARHAFTAIENGLCRAISGHENRESPVASVVSQQRVLFKPVLNEHNQTVPTVDNVTTAVIKLRNYFGF